MSETERLREAVGLLIRFPFFFRYLELSFVEYMQLGLQGGERMLFIGGGPLPVTPILWAIFSRLQRTGTLEVLSKLIHRFNNDPANPEPVERDVIECFLVGLSSTAPAHQRIITIDCDANANAAAERVISRLSLAGELVATVAQGETLVVDPETEVVAIASMVEPKIPVLENIFRQSGEHPGTRVIVRSADDATLKGVLHRSLPRDETNLLLQRYPNISHVNSFSPFAKSKVVNSFDLYLSRSPTAQ